MSSPNATIERITDPRLAELVGFMHGFAGIEYMDAARSLEELQEHRKFQAELADDPQMTICPYCIHVFQSDDNRKTEAMRRFAKAALNYIRYADARGPDRIMREVVTLAARQVGLE